MFLKLHWFGTRQEVVFNTDHVIRFGKGGGPTWIVTSDGKEYRDIKETPDEILEALAGGQK